MTNLYKVAHGSITRAGVTFKRGDEIELTDAEAASAFYAKRVVAAGASVDASAARIAELEQLLCDAEDKWQAAVERIAELEKPAAAPQPPPAVGKPKK